MIADASDAAQVEFVVSKITPVAGDVLVLRCPRRANYDGILKVLQKLMPLLAEGVSVAALDEDFNVLLCNVPEFLAMITKPEVVH